MFFTPTLSEVYYSISKGYFEIFQNASEEINAIRGDKPSYDLLSHSQEENNRFQYFEQVQRQTVMISIVFQAFAIESYVNLIAVNLYDEDEFFGKFEEMGTIKKIKKIFSEKLRNDFIKNEAIYDLVKSAFDLRDKLAHSKSKRVNLLSIQENPDFINPYELLSDYYEKIDEVVTAYPKFKELVNGLIGHDIFENQMSNLHELMSANIQDIYRNMIL